MSSNWFNDVKEFHKKFGVPIGDSPRLLDEVRNVLRHDLEFEELMETYLAGVDDDITGIADGVIDSIYVNLGRLVEMGIDPAPLWDAVHAANMAKDGGGQRADGKILKPEGWQAPDIRGLLDEQAREPPQGRFVFKLFDGQETEWVVATNEDDAIVFMLNDVGHEYDLEYTTIDRVVSVVEVENVDWMPEEHGYPTGAKQFVRIDPKTYKDWTKNEFLCSTAY